MSCEQKLSSTAFPYPALRQTLHVVLHSCHLDILTWQKFVSVYGAALHLVNLTNACTNYLNGSLTLLNEAGLAQIQPLYYTVVKILISVLPSQTVNRQPLTSIACFLCGRHQQTQRDS